MSDTDHDFFLTKLFSSLEEETFKFGARESASVEFKESFNWNGKDKYGKTMAAFSNSRGGYLVFGVSNSPRKLVGLSSAGFENQDEAIVTSYLNGTFSPEIRYEKLVRTISTRTIGVIYTYPAENRPVVAVKTDGDIREAEIYYRYSARSEKIKYPELKNLFDLAREHERKSWMELFQRISKIGPTNAGIMDLVEGTIEGDRGSLLIDASLIPKLQFVREGSFSPSGKPTLKLIGDVRPIASVGNKGGPAAVRFTDDRSAPVVREETVLDQYPLTYGKLLRLLRARYSDFKENSRFHNILKPLKSDKTHCKTRFLDPARPRGARKDFYSESILDEFDKIYERTNPKNVD